MCSVRFRRGRAECGGWHSWRGAVCCRPRVLPSGGSGLGKCQCLGASESDQWTDWWVRYECCSLIGPVVRELPRIARKRLASALPYESGRLPRATYLMQVQRLIRYQVR